MWKLTRSTMAPVTHPRTGGSEAIWSSTARSDASSPTSQSNASALVPYVFRRLWMYAPLSSPDAADRDRNTRCRAPFSASHRPISRQMPPRPPART